MRDFLSKHTDFQGVITSSANPPINSFKELVNLKQDFNLGSLINRQGVRHLVGETLQLASVDGYFDNDFGDIKSRVALGRDTLNRKGVYVRPGFVGDSQNSSDVELTDNILLSINSVGANTLVITLPITGRWTNINSFLYTIVRNISKIPHEYAVVISVSGTTLTLNRAHSWLAGESIFFYKSDLQTSVSDDSWATGNSLPYTINTTPQFINVGGKNNLGIFGVSDDITGSNLWVGRITNRKYFGASGFSFNGLYATSMMEDFTRGAFNSNDANIQLKVVTTAATTTQERLDPTSDVGSTGWTATGGTIPSVLADGDTPNDANYDSTTANFTPLSIRMAPPTTATNPDGFVFLKFRAKSSVAGKVLHIRVNDGTRNVYLSSTRRPLGLTTAFEDYKVVIQSNQFTSYALIDVFLTTGDTGGATITVSYMALYVSSLSLVPISISDTSNVFVSFSMMLDGFNETKLIYSANYGRVVSAPTTYEATNAITITPSSDKFISIRIGTSHAELLNRRVTELKVYTAVTAKSISILDAKDLVWRLTKRIDINDAKWTYSNGEYYIEIYAGDEIKTGEIYIDRTTYSPSDDLKKKAYYATYANNRVFVRNDSDKNTIYFSPNNVNGFSNSVFPSSNFFLLNKTQAEINGLSSVNNRLIVWKQFSIWSVNIDGLPDTPADTYISLEKGLASLKSIAIGNRIVYFASYDGVYSTDGFKLSFPLNLSWIEEYREYTQAQKEASLGFYDTYTDTYFLYIASKLWALDTKTGFWRNENLTTVDNGVTYGIPSIVGKDFNDRLNIYSSIENVFYEYPRSDAQYYDTFYIGGASVIKYPFCSWETVDIRSEAGLDELMYSNNAYIFGESFETGLQSDITFSILRGGTVVKSNFISRSQQLTPLTSRVPFDKYSLRGTFNARDLITIKEFGIYMKAMKRTGSAKNFNVAGGYALPVSVVLSIDIECVRFVYPINLCLSLDGAVLLCGYANGDCSGILGAEIIWLFNSYTSSHNRISGVEYILSSLGSKLSISHNRTLI